MSKNARKECSMDKAPMIAELHKRWFCSRVPVTGGSHSESAIKARSHRFVGNAACGDQGWDYGNGGRNDTLVTNAVEFRNISRALWIMD